MQILEECLKKLLCICDDHTTLIKQKALSTIVTKLLEIIEVPARYQSLKDCITTVTSLHKNYPETPGNIISGMLRLEMYPDIKDLIEQSRTKIASYDELDNIIKVVSDKTASTLISSRIDQITSSLFGIKESKSDSEIVDKFKSIITSEYIGMLNYLDSDQSISVSITPNRKFHDIFKTIKSMQISRARVPSGIPSIDTIVNPGFEATRVYVFGGKPGLGKSALTLYMMINAARHIGRKEKDKPDCVVYVTLENDIVETLERIMRIILKRNVTYSDIKEQDLEYVENQFSIMCNIYLQYLPPHKTTTNDLMITLGKISEENTMKAIYVDYLNLLSLDTRRNLEKRHELGIITSELKIISKKFKCPLIVPTQINTAGYDVIPTMKNIDESRQIAQNADFVGLIFEVQREKLPPQVAYNYPEDKYSIIGINVDKNRNGPRGLCFLLLSRETFTFESLDVNIGRQIKKNLVLKNGINNENTLD